MKIQFWEGILPSFIAIATLWLVHRFYLKLGRRCRKCGSVFKIKRINKIRLAPDETISIRSTEGIWRWWIRRVETETFAVCDNSWKEMAKNKFELPYVLKKCGWKESVKVGRVPISIWHAWWVKLVDKEQYYDNPDLVHISIVSARDRLRRSEHLLANKEMDTPSVDLTPPDPGNNGSSEDYYPPVP